MPEAIFFERTIQLFLGNKAYQIAGTANTKGERKKWYLKTIQLMLKKVDLFDTSLDHKKRLMLALDQLADEIKKNDSPSFKTIDSLFRLCGSLIGFCRGARIHSLVYHQTMAQYYTAKIINGGDPLQNYHDHKDAISLRKEIAKELKDKGLDLFKIALILNTSEYKIKQLLKAKLTTDGKIS